jgi:hypothetical protein
MAPGTVIAIGFAMLFVVILAVVVHASIDGDSSTPTCASLPYWTQEPAAGGPWAVVPEECNLISDEKATGFSGWTGVGGEGCPATVACTGDIIKHACYGCGVLGGGREGCKLGDNNSCTSDNIRLAMLNS